MGSTTPVIKFSQKASCLFSKYYGETVTNGNVARHVTGFRMRPVLTPSNTAGQASYFTPAQGTSCGFNIAWDDGSGLGQWNASSFENSVLPGASYYTYKWDGGLAIDDSIAPVNQIIGVPDADYPLIAASCARGVPVSYGFSLEWSGRLDPPASTFPAAVPFGRIFYGVIGAEDTVHITPTQANPGAAVGIPWSSDDFDAVSAATFFDSGPVSDIDVGALERAVACGQIQVMTLDELRRIGTLTVGVPGVPGDELIKRDFDDISLENQGDQLYQMGAGRLGYDDFPRATHARLGYGKIPFFYLHGCSGCAFSLRTCVNWELEPVPSAVSSVVARDARTTPARTADVDKIVDAANSWRDRLAGLSESAGRLVRGTIDAAGAVRDVLENPDLRAAAGFATMYLAGRPMARARLRY